MTNLDLSTLRLETARLILRPLRPEDLDPWVAFMADEEAARHIGGRQHRSPAWRSFMCMAGAWSMQGFSMFSLIERATGRWVGRVGPWQPADWPGTEVGWGVAREHWGKGFAPEAAAAAIDWAFDHLGWNEVIHVIAPTNTASQAVAKKLGSRNRGPGKLPPDLQHIEVDIWGQTREEWRAR